MKPGGAVYACIFCRADSTRYAPACPACGKPNALAKKRALSSLNGRAPTNGAAADGEVSLLQPSTKPLPRVKTGLGDLDELFGRNALDDACGPVLGAAYILTGGPGAGKTTLAMLIAHAVLPRALYAASEGSDTTWGDYAARIGKPIQVPFMRSKNVSTILARAEERDDLLLIVDQIHACDGDPLVNSKRLVEFAGRTGRMVLVLAERVKDGSVKGSHSVEYTYDATISIDQTTIEAGKPPPTTEVLQRRWITTSKNRFGPNTSIALKLGAKGWTEIPKEVHEPTEGARP